MKRKLIVLLLALSMITSLAACGTDNTAANEPQSPAENEEEVIVGEACPATPATEQLSTVSIEKDGRNSDRDEVLKYLTTYGGLPEHYITTEEAQEMGWTDGNLEDVAPGCIIGGDVFDNQAGLLPEGPSYLVCDVDPDGQEGRSSHQLVYAHDLSVIYYSEDGGESFRLIYRAP